MAITRRCSLFPPPSLLSRLQTLLFERWQHTSAGESERSPCRDATSNPQLKEDSFDILTWKTVDSRAVGIRRSAITYPTWTVLNILQSRGFESYLVGGCVRDLLLKKTPKDFDVVTTASLKQIKKHFHRCFIVGIRFPICMVYILGSIVEVSSFDTTQKNINDRKEILSTEMLNSCDKKDIVRWKNCMRRDFTINSLFYDPFVNAIYDYANGISDLRTSKLRTIIPAHLSFQEDCARILRGLRIAARLGLRFSKETAAAIRDLSSSIMTLAESRLMRELNFMLAYGAAESSILLLQRFKLLEIILPVQASYLSDQTTKRSGESSVMLMKLFSSIDRLFAVDRPSNCSLWIGVLAFHLALLYHPQDALVISTFSSILYHGTWSKAVTFARESSKVPVQFSPEILVPSGTKSDESLLKEISHFASLVKNSVNILTNPDVLQCSLGRYPDSSSSLARIFVSKKMGNSVKQLFDVLETDIESYDKKREVSNIDYELLKKGDPDETRFVLGKIIMDTMNCGTELTSEQNPNVDAKEQDRLDELTREQNWNTTATEETPMAESHLDKLTREQNQTVENVAEPEKSHLRELTGELDRKVTVRKSRKLNPNAVAVEKCCLGELTQEQIPSAAVLESGCLPLSALFK